MLLKINPQNPSDRKIRQVTACLENGGVIIYPTDTVYGLGCDLYHQKAVERICRIRALDPKKTYFSLICKDISQLASFSQQIDNQVFKLLKKHIPGPFTFVLKSGSQVPKKLNSRRKTIGFRIPDNEIVKAINESLGHPFLSISLKSDDEVLEYFTDPSEIYDDYQNLVDMVIDGGPGSNIPSTVVDCSNRTIEIIREGAGILDF